MKMELFDIETRKYETDFLISNDGDYIVINKCKLGYKIYDAIQKKNSERHFRYNKDCAFTDKIDEMLKTLCGLTGAVVYGNRYVLSTTKSGIFCENGCYVLYLKGERIQSLTTETTDYYQKYKQLPTEDILPFEEYSKSLRNKENKLEQILTLIK
jgi:hypothetical protein